MNVFRHDLSRFSERIEADRQGARTALCVARETPPEAAAPPPLACVIAGGQGPSPASLATPLIRHVARQP